MAWLLDNLWMDKPRKLKLSFGIECTVLYNGLSLSCLVGVSLDRKSRIYKVEEEQH